MVSIIIPNYNHASYLRKRIDSVLNQTYQDFEVIIMDDCSTDNSRDIIESYRTHQKVSHVVFNPSNSGTPFIQWERGFALAKGDIIWIAESDDYVELNFLESLVPLFFDGVGLVYADSNVVDAHDIIHPDYYKRFRNERFKTKKWNNDYIKDGITELRENLFYECTINNMSATLFKKELLTYVDINFLKSYKYCGDWFFLVSLAMHTKVAYSHHALNYFKYGTNNFKKGTRSVLNYFKERFLVRYYFWNLLKFAFSKEEKEALLKQFTSEMRIQINEMIKGKSNVKGTFKMFSTLKKINRNLFKQHISTVLKSYIWKG